MELDPSALPPSDCYKLLIGTIVPRPIALVSTISAGGRTNLAPFSFFTGVGSNPMLVLFCPASAPDGTEKDTLRNASLPGDHGGGGNGEFVINSAVEGYAHRMAACAEPLAYGQSEFDLSGLTPAPSRVVRPPRVLESPVALECRTVQVIRTNPGAPSGGNIVIGRVVHVFIRDELINDRLHVSPDALKAIGRMGGMSYVRTSDPTSRFDLPMGRRALDR
jgi:flavin reductase (DIM6/NTAB) family NADH-FMN oxidoreductase RutF